LEPAIKRIKEGAFVSGLFALLLDRSFWLLIVFQTESSLSGPAAQEDEERSSIAKAVEKVNRFVSALAALWS